MHNPPMQFKPQSAIEIIQQAIREAALAPSPDAALDVTGAALLRLADMTRAGVSRG